MKENNPKALHNLMEQLQEDIMSEKRTDEAIFCVASEELEEGTTSRCGFVMGKGGDIIRSLLVQMVRYPQVKDLLNQAVEAYEGFNALYGDLIRNEKPTKEIVEEHETKSKNSDIHFS